MEVTLNRRQFVTAAASVLGMSVLGCGMVSCGSNESAGSAGGTANIASLSINNAAWNYDEEQDVYYQIGLPYCTNPQATDYESYAIYVPGAYLNGTENADGTYTCTLSEKGAVGDYTASTAPIVMPINTAGYSAQKAPTEYSAQGLSDYLSAGFVYVYAGCRGRDNITDSNGAFVASGGAPWGVTDLKSCIRALRYNAKLLPGNTDRIFSFGHSGGGAQSAVLGATGNADEYTPYLQKIGAAEQDESGASITDDIAGAMCWCPITNLDFASEAYEWNMGQFATSGTRKEGTFTEVMSKDMAKEFADHLNSLGLKDADGNALELDESENGVYCAGSYYDYLLGVIQDSLNTFLKNTEFPYTPSSTTKGDMGAAGGGPSGDDANGGKGSKPDGAPSGDAPSGDSAPSGEPPSDGGPSDGGPSGSAASADTTTYKTAKAYIAHLNEDVTWVEYDADANTAKVTSLEGFATSVKTASKDVGAFDDFNLNQAENKLFGNDANDALHFDAAMCQLLTDNSGTYAALSDWNDDYPDQYQQGYGQETDALGSSSQDRQDLYNPLYYLTSAYAGNGTSTVAPNWRIRTGITQGDTALTTEVDLALALQNKLGTDSVDFATVWGQGHTTAEISGDSTANFISWVNACCK